MRTLGLIGGMSWESTLPYYRLINQRVAERLGGLHSAKLLLASVDFAEIEVLQREARWDEAGARLADTARALVRAGAQCIALCTNTMHRVAPAIEAAVDVPLLHIADATAASLRAGGHRRVGLLATRFTMEQPFLRERLEREGFDVRVPDTAGRDDVHRIIYEELCRGRVLDASRARYREVIAALEAEGVDAIILGCTEIMLLVDAGDARVPLHDTTTLHARALADWAIEARAQGPGHRAQ